MEGNLKTIHRTVKTKRDIFKTMSIITSTVVNDYHDNYDDNYYDRYLLRFFGEMGESVSGDSG